MDVPRVPIAEVKFDPEAGPNGNYIYQGDLFTGTAYSLFKEGHLRSEQRFREGLLWGLTQEWYKNGTLYHEAHFFRDVIHGTRKEWHENGQMSEFSECRFGIVLESRVWDEKGHVIKQFDRTLDDPAWAMIARQEVTHHHELPVIEGTQQTQ